VKHESDGFQQVVIGVYGDEYLTFNDKNASKKKWGTKSPIY